MKKIIAALFLIVNLFSISAQEVLEVTEDFSLEVSEPYPVIDGLKYYFSSINGEEVYAFKIRKKEIFLQRFSVGSTFQQVKAKVIEMNEPFTLEAVDEIGGHYYMFYSVYDKSAKTEQLFVREIDFQELKFKSKGDKLISIKGKLTGAPFGTFSIGTVDKFDFIKSKDGSKMMITYRKVPQIKNDSKNHDVIGMVVYDKGLKELWSQEVKMPYTEKKMDNLDYTVDSKGNAYIMALIYDSDNTQKYINGKINYHIELIKVKADSAQMLMSKINLEGKGINTISLYQDAKDNVVCAGFYNTSKSMQDTVGFFVFKLGENGDIKESISHEIPVSVLNSNVNNSEFNKNIKEDVNRGIQFKNLKMRDLVFFEDGSIVLTAEEFNVTSRTDTRTGSTTYKYYYNDILITKIGPKGELVWMEKLGKRQRGSVGKGDMSFEYIYANGAHYMYFLDNVKNLTLKTNERPEIYIDRSVGLLMAYKINDNTGEVTKVSILDTRSVKLNEGDEKGIPIYQFYPSKVVKINEKEFVFETYIKKKRDMLIKISLD